MLVPDQWETHSLYTSCPKVNSMPKLGREPGKGGPEISHWLHLPFPTWSQNFSVEPNSFLGVNLSSIPTKWSLTMCLHTPSDRELTTSQTIRAISGQLSSSGPSDF